VRWVTDGLRPVLTEFDMDRGHDFETVVRGSRTRGMVTVVEGCNEFCTFCVVPYTRGRELSRPCADVLREVRSVAESGLKEVELLGQTINSYRCPITGADFSELLAAVTAEPGLERVRFVTSHPRHFTQELIDTLASSAKVSRYLHLPFQAGSDPILKRMHRRYTASQYLELVARIRAAVPEINLSTDVIVGFPGETEDDFTRTLDVLERVRFGQVFAFAYSPRPRTPAAKYEGQVAESAKKERLHRLFEISDRISHELNLQLVGRTVSVLVDNNSRRDAGTWQGRGDDNRVVNFPKTGREAVGDIVDVRLLAAGPHSLAGERPASGPRLPALPTVPRQA
jgi:tRNA-2-methylthio-N6-dimethylallyladenosine synthase